MYNYKNSKGITMITLAITILVLLVLAFVGGTIGINNIRNTKDYKLSSELQMVQHAVLEQYTKYKTTKDATYLLGNKVSTSEVETIANEIGVTLVTIPDTYSNKDYYRLDKASLTALGIKESTDEYIINYTSGEVINITFKTLSNGEPLYTRANSFLN